MSLRHQQAGQLGPTVTGCFLDLSTDSRLKDGNLHPLCLPFHPELTEPSGGIRES